MYFSYESGACDVFHLQLTSAHLLAPVPVLPQVQHVHNGQVELGLGQRLHGAGQGGFLLAVPGANPTPALKPRHL